MERDPHYRYSQVVLMVEWDPETQDHPAGWGWDVLLEPVKVEMVDFDDYFFREV